MLIIALLICIGLWGMKKVYEMLNVAKTEESQMQSNIEKEKEMLANIEKILEARNGETSEAKKVFEALPDEDALPIFISQISALSKDSGLILLAIDPSNSKSTNYKTNGGSQGINTMDVSLKLTGSYEGFKNFIKSIESLSRYVDISSASIEANKTSQSNLFYDFSFDLIIYYLSK